MALSDDEPCLFPQKPKSQVPFNPTTVPSSHRLEAPTTTRQSISIPQQQIGSTECYWIQPSSVTTQPQHWTSTYRQTYLPSNVNVNVNIDISISTTIENSNTWMSSSQSLASPIQARVTGTYDLLSHHSPLPSIPSNDVSWHTNTHWQDDRPPFLPLDCQYTYLYGLLDLNGTMIVSRLYGLLRFRPLLRILQLFISRERHQQPLQWHRVCDQGKQRFITERVPVRPLLPVPPQNTSSRRWLRRSSLLDRTSIIKKW